MLQEPKHGVERVTVVEASFEGANQSTHHVVVLLPLFGFAPLNGEVFDPLKFLTSEPFLGDVWFNLSKLSVVLKSCFCCCRSRNR